MAFNLNRFTRQTLAFNSGQLTASFNPSVTPELVNGPAMYSYASDTDSLAVIGAPNYFSSVIESLYVNDWIFVTGSDASAFYQVLTVDYDAKTITTGSAFPSGVVGTANIQNSAVTEDKIADLNVTEDKLADGAVTADKIDANLVQHLEVNISAAEINGMYASPVELVPAAGANTLLVLDKVVLVMTYGSAQYQAGGNVHVQYDDTANGGGVLASSTLSASDLQGAASASLSLNQGSASAPFSSTVNKGLFLSNASAAFTTGDSDVVAHCWFKVIPTA